MDAKYLILGATGSIGSNLANKLYDSNENIHLVGRNADELKSLSDEHMAFNNSELKSPPPSKK